MRHFFAAFLLALFVVSCTEETPEHHETPDTAHIAPPPPDSGSAQVADTAHSQQPVATDCAVLHRRIPPLKNQRAIDRDLSQLVGCGVDSFDYVYVVPNLFPRWLGELQVQGNDSVTYSAFVGHLNEFKLTSAYVQLHQRVHTLDSLRSTPYDPKKVYYMKPVLGKLGFTEPEWEMFLGFSRTYPIPEKGVFTWGDMLDAFEKYNKVP